MAEARLLAMEAEMVNMKMELQLRPTVKHIADEIEKNMGMIRSLLESMLKGRDRDDDVGEEFRYKSAADNKPSPWSGKKDKVDFSEYSNSLKNWADALHDEGTAMMEEYETSQTPIDEAQLDEIRFPKIKKFSKALYRVLVNTLTGEPQIFVKNQKRGTGISVWRDITQS